MTLLLLLLTLSPQDELYETRRGMEKACAKVYKDLGTWCERQKLHAAARKNWEESLRYAPTDRSLQKKVAGDLKEDAPKNAEKAAKSLKKQEDKLVKMIVKAWSTYAKTAEKLKEKDFAAFWWMKMERR